MDRNRFAELIARDFARELGQAEKAELRDFLKDEHFAEVYARLKTAGNDADVLLDEDKTRLLNTLRSRVNALDELQPAVLGRVKPIYGFKKVLAVAAILLISVLTGILGYIYLRPTDNKPGILIMSVKDGSPKRSFRLGDGTTVVLNAGSRITYPATFHGHTREVTLQGEAYFDVEKDPIHPFVIHTRDLDVRVLGTAFNVRAYAEELETQTTLIRGKVEVTLNNEQKQTLLLLPSNKLSVRKVTRQNANGKGEAGVEKELTVRMSPMQLFDSTVVETSWLQDKLIFKDTPLSVVCNSIEKKYGVQISIRNEALRKMRFSASFTNESVHDVLDALSSTENFNYNMRKKSVVIY